MADENIFSGLKVVDLASFLAGPGAATILSDFGADVIKVEPPGIRRPTSAYVQNTTAAGLRRELRVASGLIATSADWPSI